ncbi:MAG: response regulator [Planctomycetes bacterium]|nr:response regulator [Planctomycetota bacterium]
MNILVVDSESDSRRAYAELLVSAGHAARTARSAPEATAAINGYRPDLILLDLKLPDLQGLEVARMFAGRDDTRDIPIVVVTPLHLDEERDPAGLPGIRRVIYKPCRPRTLLESVEEVLRYPRP